MLASVVFIGAVLCAVGFMAWLAFFILNRSFNTFLETDRESRRYSRNYLIMGAILLVAAIGLGLWFTQLPAPLPKPEMGPGMPLAVTPPPPDEIGWNKTMVAGAMVLSAVAFLLWLGAFALNRSFNTSLRTARDARRSAAGQLVIGAALLVLTAFLAGTFFRLDKVPPVTEVTAGMEPIEGTEPPVVVVPEDEGAVVVVPEEEASVVVVPEDEGAVVVVPEEEAAVEVEVEVHE